jgi:transcriptional regulator with XRE-family HTH domain
LGTLIERRFADATSPVRSYSELERRSGISREALSRYVTPRADRRRSPTIETVAGIADALHVSLEQVSRAAVAGAHGDSLPEPSEQQVRAEVLAPLVAGLSESQFAAVLELLRQMQPGHTRMLS